MDPKIMDLGEQPLSMITINTGCNEPPDKQDLLTLRILEASERKMNLIKDLLTPEQYDSIKYNLMEREVADNANIDHTQLPKLQMKNKESTSVSLPAGSNDQNLEQQKMANGLSTSSEEIKMNIDKVMNETLERKRQAIEFFFDEVNPTQIGLPLPDRKLVIEMRSGYYLGDVEQPDKPRCLYTPDLSLVGIFFQIINFFSQIFKPGKATNREEPLPALEESPLDRYLDTREPIACFRSISSKPNLLFEVDDNANLLLVDAELCPESIRTISKMKLSLGRKTTNSEDQTNRSATGQVNLTAKSKGYLDQKANVDLMFNRLFYSRHQMHNFNEKLHIIMNRFDICLLDKMLTGSTESGKIFLLDPFVSSPELEQAKIKSIRQSVITLRWINKFKHLVYLSDYENKKIQALQQVDNTISDDSTNDNPVELQWLSIQKGYKLIEQQRRIAENYLRKFDCDLRQICSVGRALPMAKLNRQEEILHEPKLRLINIATIAEVARQLKPKRVVRRPLLPDRKQHRTRSRSIARNVDLEGQVNIQSLHNRLQLVVTVQKASNVPLRIDRSVARPISPFISSAPSSTIMLRQQERLNNNPSSLFAGSPLSPIPHGSHLSPPTTYVELVFQRKQSATSLATGTNPAWNETLFLPVETAQHASKSCDNVNFDALASLSSQLFDESLQLNLYDYHTYVQESWDGYTNSRMAGSMVHESTNSQKTISASKHHVERYLLGSVRIPLATLLSTGRMDGSFCLNQPLLLDNYQMEDLESMDPSQNSDDTSGRRKTSVNLFIALDPPMFIQQKYLQQYRYPLGTIETEQVHELATLWQDFMSTYWYRVSHLRLSSAVVKQTKSSKLGRKMDRRFVAPRHVRALIMQKDMKYRIVYRVLKPLTPPKDLCTRPVDIYRIARFVSLFKPLKKGYLTQRHLSPSIWFDSEQLVNHSIGGDEEKAVLLCNYLLYLGKNAALALVDSIPQGRSVLVIVWPNQVDLFSSDQTLRQGENEINSDDGDQQEPTTCLNFLSRLPILISTRTMEFWVPESGERHLADESNFSVVVGSIVTVENVYANIQVTDNVKETNFDIRLRQCWTPLFESVVPLKRESNALSSTTSLNDLTSDGSLQHVKLATWRQHLRRIEALRRLVGKPLNLKDDDFESQTQLNYAAFDSEQCGQLENILERSIKIHLLKWRPQRPTYFNRTLSRIFAEKLASFENNLGKSLTEDSWRSQLARTIKDEVLVAQSFDPKKRIVSWPINLSYTSTSKILDLLFASGLHDADLAFDFSDQLNAPASSQFLVACHVHSHPARIMSVWLYVAAIVSECA